jgi:hypothetical protein
MTDLVKDFLWLGIEDFTGLWDAALTAQTVEGFPSFEPARDRARTVLEYLLAEGLVDLYQSRGFPQNDAAPVARKQQAGLLHDYGLWSAPRKEDDFAVWFDTTEKGFVRYCELYNGGLLLPRQ